MCGVVLDNPLIAHRVQLEERLPRLILHECHSYVEVGMPEKNIREVDKVDRNGRAGLRAGPGRLSAVVLSGRPTDRIARFLGDDVTERGD